MKSRNLLESLGYAFAGLAHCMKYERNFKIHVSAAILVVILSLLLDIGATRLLLVLFAIFFVLCAEIFNTAIEAFCNMLSEEYNPFAKIAKDCAAAAVLLSAINAVIVGAVIFLPKLLFS